MKQISAIPQKTALKAYTRLFTRMALAAVVTLAIAGHALAENILDVSFDSSTDLQKSGAVIETQADGKPALVFGKTAQPQSLMYFWLKNCTGKRVKFSIMAKGSGLSKGFLFGLQASKDGKTVWPGGAATEMGFFDWREFTFTADFGALGTTGENIRLGLQNTEGQVAFRDLKAVVEGVSAPVDATVNPIARQFMAGNKFQLPDYTSSKNLIQNPSFEDGLDFWFNYCSNTDGGAPQGKPFVSIDETTFVTGKRSMRLESTATTTAVLSNYQLPMEKGKEYTLSFYAKTDRPNDIRFSVGGCTETWDDRLRDVDYSIGTEWKRYTYTFTAAKNVVSFSIGNRKAVPSVVWIDDVQLELGKTPTDFTTIPGSVSLLTSTYNNLSQPGEKADVRFRVQTAAPEEGTIHYVLRDFYGKTLSEDNQSFKTLAAREPVELPVLEVCDTLPSGEYVIKATMKLKSGFKHDTYHRVVRMKYADGSHKHKGLFSGCVGNKGGIETDWDDNLLLYKRIGLGSMVCFGAPAQDFQKRLEANDMFVYGCLFTGRTLGKYNLCQSKNSTQPEISVSAVKDEEIPLIAEECKKFAAANPQVKVWKTLNEPFNHSEDEIKRVVQILTAVRKAVKEVSPDAKILTPDCANMDQALMYLDTFFKNGGKEACDAIGIHLYVGNANDLDGTMKKLIGLANRHKPGIEIWSTEGGFYFPYPFPELGVNFYFGPECRAAHPSYDMGKGERDVFSAQTRYNITALKYADRLITAQNWNYAGLSSRVVFGFSGVPLTEIFAVNTPARFLGNSKFISDLNLGDDMRGYLFDDGSGRPVATLWGLGTTNASLVAKTLTEKVEIFDSFGNPVEIKDGKLDINQYPIFIRGSEGHIKKLKRAVEKSEFVIQEEGKVFNVKFKLAGDGKLSLAIANRFKRAVSGTLTASCDGKPVKSMPVALDAYGKTSLDLALPPVESAMRKVGVALQFKPDSGTSDYWSLPISYFAVHKAPKDFKIDGNWEKWDKIPRNTIGTSTADYEAGMRWLWDEDRLVFQFGFKDKTFTQPPSIQSIENGDSVQLFFDSYADYSIESNGRGYADDDHYYCIAPTSSTKVDLFRQLAPSWQLAFTNPGVIGKIPSTFKHDENGWSFEMEMPMREAQPINLKEGSSAGVFVQAKDFAGTKMLHVAKSSDGLDACSWRPPVSYTLMFFVP